MAKLRKSGLLIILSLLLSAGWAQEIEVLDFDAFETRYESGSDTLYIYNFWATWCAPCVKELPYFEEIGEKYSDQNVKVILVSLDFADQLESRLIPFVEKKALQSEVILLDAPNYNKWIDKVSPDWSGAIPATLITVPDRDIYEFKGQEFTFDELESWVTSLLSEN